MTNAIRRLGDRLVATLVPELTAAACEPRGWYEYRCREPLGELQRRLCWVNSQCGTGCNPWQTVCQPCC